MKKTIGLAPLTKSSLSLLSSKLHPVEPSFWESRTEAELSALQLKCENHWTRKSPFLKSGGLCWATSGLIASVVVGYAWRNEASYDWLQMFAAFFPGLLISAMLWTAVAATISNRFGSSLADKLDRALAPLSNSSEYCERALACVNKSASARKYRDNVIKLGRQLRQVDYAAMDELAQLEQQAAADARRQIACRELHGVFS